MLSISLDHVRVFLHITAAAVWVGGQLVLLGLLPTLRRLGDDAPSRAARAFARVAWPAYAVLVVTGIWNLLEVSLGDRPFEYFSTLIVKLALVVLSGVGAAAHSLVTRPAARGVWGGIGLVTALLAILLGVVLRG